MWKSECIHTPLTGNYRKMLEFTAMRGEMLPLLASDSSHLDSWLQQITQNAWFFSYPSCMVSCLGLICFSFICILFLYLVCATHYYHVATNTPFFTCPLLQHPSLLFHLINDIYLFQPFIYPSLLCWLQSHFLTKYLTVFLQRPTDS